VWKEIVESRAEDYFRPGALHLLEMLCTLIDLARQLAPLVQADPMDAAVAGQYLKFCQTTALLSQKLRLSVQSSTRLEAGILNESGAPKRIAGKADRLLFGGSDTVKW
jgi:hypothetical protein